MMMIMITIMIFTLMIMISVMIVTLIKWILNNSDKNSINNKDNANGSNNSHDGDIDANNNNKIIMIRRIIMLMK